MIKFNQAYLSGREIYYIAKAIERGETSGNRTYTAKCHAFFESTFGFHKTLLTTSCTDALEMSALLAEVKEGDEIIVPSFTFVSTANAFVLRGAKIVFCDSLESNPNIDHEQLRSLITERTKAIVVVHYAGIACEMDSILEIAAAKNIMVVEDAAQAIASTYKGRALGSLGSFGTLSFHETKNIIAGEGGLLCINEERYCERAEIIWEKGTNRAAFYRGEVDKYSWVDVGSSFLPSDLTAAFLFAQLENIQVIQDRRISHWRRYFKNLLPLVKQHEISVPYIPEYASNNGHMFYLVCRSLDERSDLINTLREAGIHAVFHYLPLHRSPYFSELHDGRSLPNADRYAECLLRLPMFVDLTNREIDFISQKVLDFYSARQ